MYGFYYDWSVIILVPAIIFSMVAQGMVSSAFKKYSGVPSGLRMTGAQAARRMLDANGLRDVGIVPIAGSLTDNYDPGKKVLHLSQSVYGVDSVSAVSVACHECGHAVQHAKAYRPLIIRNSIVPAVNLASRFSWILIIIGLGLLAYEGGAGSFGDGIFDLGVICFLAVIAFHLITLPVEIDASRRAIRQMQDLGLVTGDNLQGSKKVLRAAAMTYIAALAVAAANLLRILALRSRSD